MFSILSFAFPQSNLRIDKLGYLQNI